MEALSPTMEEGRLITWTKNEGDPVAEGDVLAEVETDKATMELVARGSGVLRKRLIGDGDTQTVGALIAVIAGEDEDISGIVGEVGASQALAGSEHTETDSAERGTADAIPGEKPTPTPDQATRAGTDEGQPSIVPNGQQQAGSSEQPADAGGNGRVKASPLARRIAAEAGMQIGDVQGSGPGGRVVKRDIEAAMQQPPAEAQPPQPAAAPPQEEAASPQPLAPAAQAGAAFRDIPLTQMRKTIAKRLAQSIGPIPTFYLTIEIDMAEAMALRARINERFAEQGVKISPNDLVIKAAAAALRRHPMVNASWTGEAIRQFDAAHIGVAVAVEEGLITPVIRDADRKGVTAIAREVRELAGRAREKKLKPEEYTGSTFSISNLGMFGIEEFTAVINPPEAAILAVGESAEKVVVVGGEMQIRPRMRVTLSCDHRVIDGATGAAFLQTFKQFLEDPMLMLV